MKTEYAVEVLCAACGVARSGYYRHLARQSQPGPQRQRDAVLSAWIEEEFAQSHGTYGVPRLHRALHKRQEPVSRKRLARLMRERGLRGCSPRRRMVGWAMSDTIDTPLVLAAWQHACQ